ncbi:hypothetical protein Tco_0827501 [Tanacetum coccineum]
MFSISASSSVPWIYLGKFWYTLKEDGSKYMLSFMLDKKELTMTLDDFRTIFQLPQATNNNHERFVATPKFSEMVPFFLNDLGFQCNYDHHPTSRQLVSYNHGIHFARCFHDVLQHELLVMINRLCRSCRCYIALSTMLLMIYDITAYSQCEKSKVIDYILFLDLDQKKERS